MFFLEIRFEGLSINGEKILEDRNLFLRFGGLYLMSELSETRPAGRRLLYVS
jgi:hypothetical protein